MMIIMMMMMINSKRHRNPSMMIVGPRLCRSMLIPCRAATAWWCLQLTLGLLAGIPVSDGKRDCFFPVPRWTPNYHMTSRRSSSNDLRIERTGIVSAPGAKAGLSVEVDDDFSIASSVQRERFLVHRGRSATMILHAPAISGLTVCRNWSAAATDALRSAARSVVKENPILSGVVKRVNSQPNMFSTGELWIESGWYDPDRHDFVEVIPTPPNILARHFLDLSPKDLLSYLDDYVAPHFDLSSSSTSDQVEKLLPVFALSLMIIPSDDGTGKSLGMQYAIFALKVSHAVGDGVTFFQILKQLSFFMSRDGRNPKFPVPSINWHFRSQATRCHELYPMTFSQRDVDVAYGLPFLVGLIKNAVLTFHKRKPAVMLLDKDKVKIEKMRMRKQLNSTSISSNDVVSLALCEANDDVDIFIFTENARDNLGVPRNAGGNFFWEIPFSSRAAVLDPHYFRDSVIRRTFYPTDQLPIQPFLCGRVGRLTSLATVTEQLVYDDVETLCTVPIKDFLQTIPMDVALIFRYNKQYLGVLHNFVQFKPSLLDALIASDE